MAISWATTHYPDLAVLQAALPAVPDWARGITIHHTWKPTQAQWRGARSMEALRRFYAAKGWTRGPHLFVAPDGIWGGTPLTVKGIHAGACNANSIGIEIVGDFDAEPWDNALAARLYPLFVALLHWERGDETNLRGHRECLANKSCPGKAINLPGVRAIVGVQLFNRKFRVDTPAARVRARPTTQSARIGTLIATSTAPAHLVRGQALEGDDRWARVRLPSGVVGYVYAPLGSFV